MAEENTPSIGGFDLLSDMLVGGATKTDEDGRLDVGNEPPVIDPKTIKAELAKEEPAEEETSEEEVEETEETEETEEETEEVEETKEETSEEEPSEEDLGEFESDVTALLNERFAEELGWNIPEENAPKTVKEFVDMMKEVVAEASAPQYANDEVKAYDEFVRNGGNLRDFYKNAVEGRVNTENVDIENSFDQKQVLTEHLVNQGYSTDRINKMIKRYEDAGVLEEEAQDALELLKDYNEKSRKKLLEEQEKNAVFAQEQQQKFVTDVEESIKNLDNIRGVKISEKDKKELLEYILVPDNEGYTKYQREYLSNIKNLLESAYFTKKGDVLINKSKAQGKSDAVKNLHDKLKANKGNRSRQSGTQEHGKTSSGLSVLGSMLQGS